MHTAPVIVPNPANKDNKVVVSQDQPLVLQCNVATSSFLPTTFQWKHNVSMRLNCNENLVPRRRLNISKVIELNRTEFVVETIQLSDAGDVTCK
ncbi:hypothetical protein BLA29_008841 [Euroglyphus maynei]|uniref:Ig-like domain-containing protein n=1 Tax=Euroglyphus maynei TaxID=6958 RepID=A0A1Y3ANS2_EURMA|nr:hypothetical protein BLA29_008841 [Euroglyphus maynei]